MQLCLQHNSNEHLQDHIKIESVQTTRYKNVDLDMKIPLNY